MANAVTAFLDDHLATGNADQTAVVTPSGGVSYGELLARVNRTGNVLRGLGVEPEQRVAMLMADSVAWAAVFFGAVRAGAVAVPLNTRLGPADLAGMLRDSRAKALVVDPALLDALRPLLPECPHLQAVVTTEPAPGFKSLDELAGSAPAELQPEPVSGDDMAVWLYTSGTTGTPKAAVHLHRDLLACRHYGVDVLGSGGSDRIYATSKLFFAYALGNALLIPLFVGAQTFLHPAWAEPAIVADVMAGFRPTLFFSVPTFYARLLKAGLPRHTFASVRSAVSAGERLPSEIYGAFRERFGVEILDGLGATETIFMVLSNRPGRSRAGAAGVVVPGTEARLLDAAGREVGEEEQGVLHVKTPSASPSYWNRVEPSRRAFLGEWFRTGDVCTRDRDGFYYHCGRADDLFKVAGMWVAPADIEAVLVGHPGVADAGVVGAADASGLTKPFAFVVPRGREVPIIPLVRDLTDLAREKLAPHQIPRGIVVVDALPRTATGKLQRFLLKQRVPSP